MYEVKYEVKDVAGCNVIDAGLATETTLCNGLTATADRLVQIINPCSPTVGWSTFSVQLQCSTFSGKLSVVNVCPRPAVDLSGSFSALENNTR